MRKRETHPGRFTNPVFLHRADTIRPAGEFGFNAFQQFFRIRGNRQVVSGDFAFLDRCTGAPAFAVDDLFVRQHSLINRIPVHHLRLAIGDAFFQHFQEQPLVPLVIVRVAGGDFTRPIERQTQRLHLRFHVSDIGVGPFGGRHIVGNRGILSRHPERIPAHRHQYIVAVHAQVAQHHVVNRVVAHMAHMQLAGWIRQHRAGVKFWLDVAVLILRVFGNFVRVSVEPMRLGFGFDCFGKVGGIHRAGNE